MWYICAILAPYLRHAMDTAAIIMKYINDLLYKLRCTKNNEPGSVCEATHDCDDAAARNNVRAADDAKDNVRAADDAKSAATGDAKSAATADVKVDAKESPTHRQNIWEFLSHFALFFKWILIAVVLGIICGLAGTAFHYALRLAADLFTTHGWLLYLLPAAGILTVLLYHTFGIFNDEGTNSILKAARAEKTSAFRVAPLIFVSSFLTHVCGGSAGREGAALNIGGSIGSFTARMLKLNRYEQQMFVMCGMSATFCALFQTPLTAAFFSIEAAGVGTMFYAGFLPAAAASCTAKLVSTSLGVEAMTFEVAKAAKYTPILVIKVAVLGIFCALLSIVFCKMMHASVNLSKKYLKNDYIRILIGGFLVIMMTLISGTRDYNGTGTAVIAAALSGTAVPWAFLMKMIMTAFTSGSGYKGGEIIPTLFIGATFGCVAAPLLGISADLGAEICLVAFFCGAVNCPVTSLLLSVEFFGSSNFLLFGISSAVSYMLSGYYSLYTGQKFMNSKESPVPIDQYAL